MESPPKTLKAKLEAIRGMAMSALNQIGESQDDVSLWDFLDAPRNILSFPPSFAPAC